MDWTTTHRANRISIRTRSTVAMSSYSATKLDMTGQTHFVVYSEPWLRWNQDLEALCRTIVRNAMPDFEVFVKDGKLELEAMNTLRFCRDCALLVVLKTETKERSYLYGIRAKQKAELDD